MVEPVGDEAEEDGEREGGEPQHKVVRVETEVAKRREGQREVVVRHACAHRQSTQTRAV